MFAQPVFLLTEPSPQSLHDLLYLIQMTYFCQYFEVYILASNIHVVFIFHQTQYPSVEIQE